MRKKKWFLVILILLSKYSLAHGFGTNGLLHPLTGADHILAMVAVGAWSAQMGGKAIYLVPCSFLAMMFLGGITGIEMIAIGKIDWMIALSVILLGLAIYLNKKISLLIASLAVGTFGFCHGYAHGTEIPHAFNAGEYITGFTITTFGLHVIGAVGTLLLLEEKSGPGNLRLLGAVTAFVGACLLVR